MEPNSLDRSVRELYGLQHFVLNPGSNLHSILYKANRDRPQGVPVHDHIRGDDDDGDGKSDPEHERLDPAKEIDLRVYSSFDGDDNWAKHVRNLQDSSPLVVFSKVRFSKCLSFAFELGIVCGPSGNRVHRIVIRAYSIIFPLIFYVHLGGMRS